MSVTKVVSDRNKALFIKYIVEGQTVEKACFLVGINITTPYRWCAVSKEFKEKYKRAKKIKAKKSIALGLHKLVEGAVQIEEKTEVMSRDEETGDYIKKSTKITHLPPNVKAIQLLASKYEPNVYKDTDNKEININISQRDRALSIEDRLAILNADAIEGETIELEANDYKELDKSDA